MQLRSRQTHLPPPPGPICPSLTPQAAPVLPSLQAPSVPPSKSHLSSPPRQASTRPPLPLSPQRRTRQESTCSMFGITKEWGVSIISWDFTSESVLPEGTHAASGDEESHTQCHRHDVSRPQYRAAHEIGRPRLTGDTWSLSGSEPPRPVTPMPWSTHRWLRPAPAWAWTQGCSGPPPTGLSRHGHGQGP